MNPVGNQLTDPMLAGSRTVRARSLFLGQLTPSRPQRAPESWLDQVNHHVKPSPLDPNLWEKVLEEAQVPGRHVIVAALKEGVPLLFGENSRNFVNISAPNHPLLYMDLNKVKEGVEEEVRHGRYVQLPPEVERSQLNLSAMGVAPRFKSFEARREFEALLATMRPQLKQAAADDFSGAPVEAVPGLLSLRQLAQGVKWRVIHDLTHPQGHNVNAFMESPYFQLPTAIGFAKKLARGAYIWKGDIDKAFRNMPVRKQDWPLLAFHIDGVLYVDTRLPFGHALSPYYFVNFVGRPILYVAARRGATILGALSAYVDDFFGG